MEQFEEREMWGRDDSFDGNFFKIQSFMKINEQSFENNQKNILNFNCLTCSTIFFSNFNHNFAQNSLKNQNLKKLSFGCSQSALLGGKKTERRV